MAALKSALKLLKPSTNLNVTFMSLLTNSRSKLPLSFSTVVAWSRHYSSSPRFSSAVALSRHYFHSSSQVVGPSELEFTEMAWEGYLGAIGEAKENEREAVETEHLMKSLLEQEDGLAPRIFTKAGIDNTSVLQATDDFIAKQQPKVSSGDPIIGQHMSSLLDNAIIHKEDMKDEFVTVEHFILAFYLDMRFGQPLFRNLGLSWKDLRDAIHAVRIRQNEQWGIDKEQIRALKKEIHRVNIEIGTVEWHEYSLNVVKFFAQGREEKAETVQLHERDLNHAVELRTSLQCQLEEAETHLAEIESKWTGTHLQEFLNQCLFGQNTAVKAVADAIQRSGAGLSDPNRPIASFMFIGPPGVGKKVLARNLSGHLFNTENAFLRIYMDDYTTKHRASRLVEVLTEAVLRRPYRVILFEEIEKAHQDVYSLLSRVVEDGKITDPQGRTVSFINTVIIMTSRIGSDLILSNSHHSKEPMNDIVRKKVADLARRKFMNRIDVLKPLKQRFRRPAEFMNGIAECVVFNPLDRSDVRSIVELFMSVLKDWNREEEEIELHYTEEAIDVMAGSASADPNFGAREVSLEVRTKVSNRIEKIRNKLREAGSEDKGLVFNVCVAPDCWPNEGGVTPAGVPGHYRTDLGTLFHVKEIKSEL